MEFHYGKAPVYYIDGVPGYQAGEWPGIKSCKFRNTRRIIQPKNQGIIFNEKEPLAPSKRKPLCPPPSQEYIFKPCCKMVDMNQFNLPAKQRGLKVTEQIFTQNKFDYEYERRHKFDYKIEKDRKQKEMEKTMNISKFIRNELKLVTTYGISHSRFDNLSNKDLYALKFGKNGKLQLNMDEDIGIQRKERIKQRKADTEYVKSLGDWENKTLKKPEENKPAPLIENKEETNKEPVVNEKKG